MSWLLKRRQFLRDEIKALKKRLEQLLEARAN